MRTLPVILSPAGFLWKMIMKKLICIFSLLLVFILSLGLPTKAASQTDTIVYASPAGAPLNAGQTLEIAIRIENVADLYAFDLEVHYPTVILEVINVELGDFLDSDGLTLFNTVDPIAGTINFAYTQLNPSTPKTGNGDLFVITVQALENIDEVHLYIFNADLSDNNGIAIPCRIINSGLSYLYLPMVLR